MRKVIMINLIIPIITLIIGVIEMVSMNGQRLMSVKYRLLLFDYGIFLQVAQVLVFVISLFVWRKRRERFIVIAIFCLWLLMMLLMPSSSLYD